MAIRPTFMGFETAKQALTISQLGLDTMGHNIANVETLGYTRQRVDQVSVNSTFNTKYQIYGNYARNAGQGARATGISQIRNTYLDTRYRNEACTYGELAIKGSGMLDLEAIFDEVMTDGLGVKFEEFIAALTKYQDNAESTEIATTVRAAAEAIINILNKNASEVSAVEAQQKHDLDVTITKEINSVLEEIAFLNEKIRQANLYGDPANELNDQRNLLIDQLSEYLPIKVVHGAEEVGRNMTIETVSIVLVNNSVTPAQQIELVNNNKFNQLAWQEDDEGFVNIQLCEGKTDFVLQDITHSITSGVVKGYVDMINGLGEFAGSMSSAQDGEVYLQGNTFRGVKYYQKALDTFAREFASLMNNLNSISQAEADAYQTVTAYPDKPLFEARDGSGEITASNITLSWQWREEVTYLTTTKMDQIEVPVYDEDGNFVLDEEGNKVMELSAKNDNLLKFVEALQSQTNYFKGTTADGDSFVLFKGGFSEMLVNIQSTLALDKQLNKSLLETSDLVIETYANQRMAISGVNADEEAVNMMMYQNYYNAAARYMTVLDEALGTIIQGMGVVGR